MKGEILEYLDYYIDMLNKLEKKEHSTPKTITYIVNDVLLILMRTEKKEKRLPIEIPKIPKVLDRRFLFHFSLEYNGSSINFDTQTIYQLLLKNRKFLDYLNETYLDFSIERIKIECNTGKFYLSPNIFEKHIWLKVLKRISNNKEINLMKKRGFQYKL
jgi:hypothetical protein